MAGSEPADAGSTPAPGSFALVVKRTSWLPPKEQVQVRFLAGVLQEKPAKLKRQSTAPVMRHVWVRAPPLAHFDSGVAQLVRASA